MAGTLGTVLPPNTTPLSPPTTNFFPVPSVNSPSAVNQLRNGEYNNSANTWFEMVSDPTSDQGHECALWFSNDEPANGQLLSENDSITDPGVDNQTLKSVGHPFYDPEFSDWDRENGWARFQGTTSIDTPMPTNTKAGLTQFFGGLLALNNENYPTVTYIMPEDTLIYAGLWDDTVGQLDWLPGIFDFTFSAIQGTPSGTTERRYKIFARTDRGYSFLSDELVVANAPDDSSFATSSVYMTWRAVPGVLEYDIYRHDIGTGDYFILDSIGNGSTAYSDDGHILKSAVGYPTPTNPDPIAFVATYPGDLDSVPVNGTGDWEILWLNIAIPSTYDMSNTTAAQWLRLYMSKAMDRSIGDLQSTEGSTTVSASVDRFTALDNGRMATLTSGSLVHGPEAVTYVDAQNVTFATPVEFTSPSVGAAATGSLAFNPVAQPADGDTLTINGAVFTFRNSPVGAYEIQIGATRPDTAANTQATLSASVDPLVTVASYGVVSAVVNITYNTDGTIGNSFTLAISGSRPVLSGATLTGGADDNEAPTLYIVEGGDHGLLIDLVHSSFVGRAAFAPNPDDLNRALLPQSAPTGSSQGGPGGGGGITPGGGGTGDQGVDPNTV